MKDIRYLASCCDNNFKIHDSITYELLHTYDASQSVPSNVTANPCKSDLSWSVSWKCLAILSAGSVEILHLKEGRVKKSSKADISTIKATAISFMTNSNRYLAIGTKRGSIIIWDCKTEKVRKKFQSVDRQGEVLHVHFNGFDSHIAASMSTGHVLVYDYATSKEQVFQVPNSKNVSSLMFQQAGRNSYLAAGSMEGHLSCWNTFNRMQMYVSTNCHSGSINDIAFSRVNHKLIASVSSNQDLCIHDLVLGPHAAIRVTTPDALTTVDLCPEGCLALVGTSTGHLLTYDLRRYSRPLRSEQIHNGAVGRIRFSRDGNQEASGPTTSSVAPQASSSPSVLPLSASNGVIKEEMITQIIESPLRVVIPKTCLSHSLFSPIDSANMDYTLEDNVSDSFACGLFMFDELVKFPEANNTQDVKPSLSRCQLSTSTPSTNTEHKSETIPSPTNLLFSPIYAHANSCSSLKSVDSSDEENLSVNAFPLLSETQLNETSVIKGSDSDRSVESPINFKLNLDPLRRGHHVGTFQSLISAMADDPHEENEGVVDTDSVELKMQKMFEAKIVQMQNSYELKLSTMQKVYEERLEALEMRMKVMEGRMAL